MGHNRYNIEIFDVKSGGTCINLWDLKWCQLLTSGFEVIILDLL